MCVCVCVWISALLTVRQKQEVCQPAGGGDELTAVAAPPSYFSPWLLSISSSVSEGSGPLWLGRWSRSSNGRTAGGSTSGALWGTLKVLESPRMSPDQSI